MSEQQLSLPGMGVAVLTDRLFLALFPDAGTAGQIAVLAQRLRAQHRLQGRPLAPGRLHVTLAHLGDFCGGLPQSHRI